MADMEKIERLAAAIEHHDRLYWQDAAPEISDEQYDALVRELRDLAPDHPVLHRINSPDLASEGKIRHSRPMLSLDKAYSLEELLNWANKFARSANEEFLVQPKYDGISANFANGVLASRGDGIQGENISAKTPLIELEAPGYRGSLDRPARGEIVIREDDFREKWPEILKKDGKPYKNSRNAVAGIMGLKDISPMLHQKAKLTFVDYRLISYTVKFADFAKRWPELVAEIENLPYPLDGIVIKLADDEYRDSLGATAHHPRGEIAFKFSGVQRPTKLLDVAWSFGKNCLTPVARLEPVEIGGITIKQASLHNVQNIIDRDIYIGDTVTVERAGDVIPYIVESVPGEKRRSCLIENCPCCETRLVREGPELRCPNPDCSETRLQNLLAAIRNIGIERLGEPNVRRMMQVLGIRTLRDIFDLTIPQILKLEGFKEKSATNLYREIQNARSAYDYELLAALNISGIGKTIAKKILSQHSLDELRRLNEEQLAAIDGIGPERANALFCELRSQSDFLNELLEALQVSQTKGGEAIKKPSICFTGKMPETRSYYERLAKERGFEPVSNVNSDLSLLVCADPNISSSKLNKAKNAGIEIVTLEEWLESRSDPENKTDAPSPAQSPETDDFLPGFGL